jgi:DNA-binding CsgD family transcriptional regulator
MYRLQRTKAHKRKVEIELLVQKMEGKNKELTSNALQILQANEIIDYTQKGLSQLKTVIDTPNNIMLTQIISDLKKGNQSFNKKEFEKLFVETDEEFYKKLLNRYPTLTKNEIRLCAFAKMNFSTKEISAIAQQSSNSILVARSRLRKKLGIADSVNFTVFFKNF